MRYLLIFFCFSSLFGSEIDLPNPKVSRQVIEHSKSQNNPIISQIRNKSHVNVVTGEYIDQAADLVLAGSEPLSFRRFYAHLAPHEARYAGWLLNPESHMVANFDYPKFKGIEIPLYVAVGEKDGSVINCMSKKDQCFTFDPSKQSGFCHNEENGQAHPLNKIINYHVIGTAPNNKFEWGGEVIDGSGGKRIFSSGMYSWHTPIDVVSKPNIFEVNVHTYHPPTWMPYMLKIHEEHLPNGNIIKYDYTRWKEDRTNKHWKVYEMLEKITVYNRDKTKILNSFKIDYNKNKTKYGDPLKFTCTGSDERVATFKTQKNEVYRISDAVPPDQPSYHYGFSPKAITDVKRPDGREFRIAYNAQNKVSAEFVVVGPKREQIRTHKYLYHSDGTDVFDAENHVVKYRYDSNKRIHTIEHHDNHASNHALRVEKNLWDDKTGNLLTKTIQYDNRVYFKADYIYDTRHNIIQETVGDGKESYIIYRTFSDDGFNLKLSETDGFGKTTRYFYIPNTNLLKAELIYDNDQVKQRTFHAYDDCAICIKTIIDDGTSDNPDDLSNVTCRKIKTITPKYSSPCFGLAEIIEEKALHEGHEVLLHKTIYAYEPSGKIREERHYDETNTLLYSIHNKYDFKERLILATDALGHQTQFIYDENHNCLSQIGPRPNQTTSWTYDKADRPTSENNNGLITSTKYNALSQIASQTDIHGNTTHYKYNTLGYLIQTTHPDGSIETKEYDAVGNLIKEIDAKGYETLKEFNFRGQPIHIIYPDNTHEYYRYHPNGTLLEYTSKDVTTYYTYDAFQRPIKEETYFDNKLLKSTSSTYNSFHKISDTDAEGITTFFTYDHAGKKTKETTLDRETYFFYDTLGRLIRTQNHQIEITNFDLLDRIIEKRTEDLSGTILFQETYAYDEAGNRTHTTCLGTKETIYDLNNLPTHEITADGSVTQTLYDHKNHITTTIDPQNVTTQTTHDTRGRIQAIEVLNPEPIQKRTFEYDLNGNQTKATDYIYDKTELIKIMSTTWQYGPNNRLEKLIESDQKETRYLYDDKGRLQVLIKPNGTGLFHTYDPLSRLQRLTSNDIDYTYSYNKKDQILEVYDAMQKKSTVKHYDAYGNLIKEKLANGKTLESNYDLYGRRTSLLYPDNTQAFFSYQGDKLQKISYQNETYTYARNTASNITEGKFLQGTIHLHYDTCQRLQKIEAPNLTQEFAYDSRGDLIHYRLNEDEEKYTYDPLRQLICENKHTYSYDSFGNRLIKDTYQHEHNELSQVTSDGQTEYIYDLNGNLISFNNINLRYDSLDRLIEVNINEKKYSYTYDPFHRRISKTTPKETIDYYWDDKNEVGSSKGELRVLGEGFGAEIGAGVFIKLGKSLYIPIHDHRGALLSLIDAKGKQENFRYTAYGEELTKSTLSPWRFASKRVDEETGYVYFGRRYYSPDLGRWITTDPNGFQDGPNLYAYVHNSPLIAVDLYGEFALWDKTRTFAKNSFDFAFPCASELFKLSADAPLWQRGMLAGGAVLEIASLAMPASRAVLPFVERGAFQLGKAAFSKIGQKSLLQQAEKTSAIAVGKGIVNDVGVTSGTKAFTQSNYRKGLIQRTGINPGKSAHAHHVFPIAHHKNFMKSGINIHDPKFLTWWESSSHLKNAKSYNEKWRRYLRTNPTQAEILEFGREIMMGYQIPTGF